MKDDFIAGATVGAMMGLIIACMISVFSDLIRVNSFKREAINQGFAIYNPQTGEWQWKTNVFLVPPGRFIEVLPAK